MKWGESVNRPWSEVWGITCREAIGKATARRADGTLDRRFRADHVFSAYYYARKAAHAAFREHPGLRVPPPDSEL